MDEQLDVLGHQLGLLRHQEIFPNFTEDNRWTPSAIAKALPRPWGGMLRFSQGLSCQKAEVRPTLSSSRCVASRVLGVNDSSRRSPYQDWDRFHI